MQGVQIWRNKAREASYRPRSQQRLPPVLRHGNEVGTQEENSQAEKMEMEVKIVGQASYGREKIPHWPHEATGSPQNPHIYVHASHQTMLPKSYKLKRELQGLKPLQEGVSLGLGTRSLLSLWYMKSGGHRR